MCSFASRNVALFRAIRSSVSPSTGAFPSCVCRTTSLPAFATGANLRISPVRDGQPRLDNRMSGSDAEPGRSDEHEVTPLELFFDLTFVFAMTQVTILLADDPTWAGVFRGMLVLAALWWAWSAYAWLTSATDVDEGGVRLVMLASMGGMFGVALAVPGAFADDAVLFGAAYLLVRLLHLVLSAIVVRADPIGVGAGLELETGVVVGAALGIVVVSALWWLYFDVAAIFARTRLMQASGLELHRLALHAYSYLHLPMIAGIVLFALGLKTTLGQVGDALDTVPAVGLCGGAALYLLGHIAFLFRTTGRVFRRRTVGAVVLLALIPVAVTIPALAALALVSAVCSLVVAYEVIRYRTARVQVRHPELAA